MGADTGLVRRLTNEVFIGGDVSRIDRAYMVARSWDAVDSAEITASTK